MNLDDALEREIADLNNEYGQIDHPSSLNDDINNGIVDDPVEFAVEQIAQSLDHFAAIIENASKKLQEKKRKDASIAVVPTHLSFLEMEDRNVKDASEEPIAAEEIVRRKSLRDAIYESNVDLLDEMIPSSQVDDVIDSKWGWTALHLAVAMNKTDVIDLLIEKGASIDIVASGEMPVHFAAAQCKEELIELLMVSTPSHSGWTPLHAAFSRLNPPAKIVRLIAEMAPKNVNTAWSYDGMTPLHLSAFRGNIEGCRILLDHGADMYAQDHKGQCPYEITSCHNTLQILASPQEIFWWYGKEIQRSGIRFLFFDEMLQLLQQSESEIDLQMQFEDGKIMLDIAIDAISLEVIIILMRFGAKVSSDQISRAHENKELSHNAKMISCILDTHFRLQQSTQRSTESKDVMPSSNEETNAVPPSSDDADDE
eukprot:TRINITY_DN3019_c0_g1_i2.p1 TRINITY_DN3019_c0_g1~~TRINITY_DN3019_c0_g1_i2.p1  ORF type:complete len:426 (-),score=98.80 TRINITY_DN3019_c0_g1_i2:25-1302(-)